MHSTHLLAEFLVTIILLLPPIVVATFAALFLMSRYVRCPANRVLVIHGNVEGNRAVRCVHGRGAMVWPVIQDHGFLSLAPMTVGVELTGAPTKGGGRANIASTFTIAISTESEIMNNAGERLLGLEEEKIIGLARDIIAGRMRREIAKLSVDEINRDFENFLDLIDQRIGSELNKVGLGIINIDLREITEGAGS